MNQPSDTFVQRLGRERLQVISQLGEGAAGTVYRVRDRETGGMLALKVLRDTSPRAVLRFQREATLTASLQHPNIVRVHSTGVYEGRCVIAYELVEGAQTLADAFHGAPLARRVELLRDVARGLGHAHSRGVVHRDVKPENVLVGEDGRARVTDFGLALTDDAERLTRTGAIVGTPYYMAPEQIDGKRRELDPRTDVWALGVLLYEALTDERPFDGSSLMDLASAITTAAPTRPSDVCAVPGRLEDLCVRALRADPAARPADGEAFARELDGWLESGGATRSPWRRRVRTITLAAALLLVVASAGVWAVSGRTAAPRPGATPDAGLDVTPTAPATAVEPAAPAQAALPAWERTLRQAITYRLVGRSRLRPDDPWNVLEWTVVHQPPVVAGDRLLVDARLLRVRCHMTTFLEVDYDSDHPTKVPIEHFEDLIGAALAAPLRIELDARTGEVLAVSGLPLGDGKQESFDTPDGGRARLNNALRPLSRWFTEPWALAYLHNGLLRLPARDAGPSYAGRRYWTATRWFELPRRLEPAGDGRFKILLDGPARLFSSESGGRHEQRFDRLEFGGEVEVRDGLVVRASSTIRFEDHDEGAPVGNEGDFSFELLRSGD